RTSSPRFAVARRRSMAVERPDLGAHLRMTFAFLIGLGGLGGGIVQIREGHMAMGIFLMLAGAFLAMLILQVNRSD
ncbi:MAG TPA: hypothetical protein VFB62_11020, partial [Polyangiaceae bacterium]|nr:hypothetical protein [Polyangiaceae bacterium]